MQILIIGCNGQLGTDMMTISKEQGHDVSGVDFPDIDITKENETYTIINSKSPDVIINCAAYTAVDACEENRDLAFSVNAEGTKNIALAAKKTGAKLVHISTDYVFDGCGNSPYIESDPTNPKSVYGQSKLLGEKNITDTIKNYFIFRIAWLYGAHGNNFVKTIRKIALQKQKTQEPLSIVNDQYGTPTWTVDICHQILSVVDNGKYGLYHCTNEGSCTWYDFTVYILKKFNIDTKILPCTSEEFKRPAPRPAYAVLENTNLKSQGLNSMSNWKDAFENFYNCIDHKQF